MAGSKLPKGCRPDENRINGDLAKIRDEYETRYGAMATHAASVLHRIRRAMTRDRLAARWLRIEGEKLTIEQRLAMAAEMTAAAETIEKCLRMLRLDVDSFDDHDPAGDLARFVNGGTASPPPELAADKATHSLANEFGADPDSSAGLAAQVRENSSPLRTAGIEGTATDDERQEVQL